MCLVVNSRIIQRPVTILGIRLIVAVNNDKYVIRSSVDLHHDRLGLDDPKDGISAVSVSRSYRFIC